MSMLYFGGNVVSFSFQMLMNAKKVLPVNVMDAIVRTHGVDSIASVKEINCT